MLMRLVLLALLVLIVVSAIHGTGGFWLGFALGFPAFIVFMGLVRMVAWLVWGRRRRR
jgi:hypothetical protein